MLGVSRGALVFVQRQPADSPVVELDELAIDFLLPVGAKRELGPLLKRRRDEIIVVGVEPLGPFAVGATLGLQLQQPHIDAHLQNFPSILADEAAHDGTTGLKGPFPQQSIDVIGARRTWHGRQ
jgi:hypothetical protein